MTEVVMIIFFMILLFAAVSGIANHIPKKGRCFDADGQEVIATITNTNRTAEKAVTIRAVDDNGRRYRAKLKASEAKLWIKGDKIRIILSDRSKNYRILFHEYFKENEERIREQALLKLQKTIKPDFIAARLTGYTKNSPEAFRASEADSHTIFAFTTYMHMIDVYSIIAVIMAAAFVVWYMSVNPEFFSAIVPLLVVLLVFFMINSTVNNCKRVLKKVNKK